LKIPANVLNSVINKDSANKSPLVKGAVSQAASAKPAQTAVKNAVKAQTTAIFDKNSLVSQLKLPQDGLSRALVTFARLFALPLETRLLSALRREALGVGLKAASGGGVPLGAAPNGAAHGKAATTVNAAALGAAAAASKGITMTESALAEYAAAIEGSTESFTMERSAEKAPANRQPGEPQDDAENSDFARNNGSGRGSGGQQDGDTAGDDGNPAQGQEGGGFQNGDYQGNHNGKRGVQTRFSDAELQDRITTILQEKPLLDFINRIPCKNGRWIVIPFSFHDNGFEFTVSLRIFLLEGALKTGGSLISERLDADIKVIPLDNCLEQYQKRWLISLKKSEDDFWAECAVFSGSEPWNGTTAEKKRVRQELAAALDLPLNRVLIKEEDFSYAESGESAFEPVDEAV
jgi:hypothetical protein